MTNRPSPRKAQAKRQWDRFVSRNQPLITATGLPAAVFSSIDHFDAFVCHGYHDPVDAREFRVESLNPAQYSALVTLAESYFTAGYEWFTPSALRPADQETLRQRFEN
jgi:hypothetical protein